MDPESTGTVSQARSNFGQQCSEWESEWNDETEALVKSVISSLMEEAPYQIQSAKTAAAAKDDEMDGTESIQYGILEMENHISPLAIQKDADELVSGGFSESGKADKQGPPRFDIEDVLKRYIHHPQLQLWLNRSALPNKSAGRAFLTHKFFKFVGSVSEKDGVVIESLSFKARPLTGSIARTIHTRNRDDLRDSIWPQVAMWLFNSLKTTRDEVFWYKGIEFLDEEHRKETEADNKTNGDATGESQMWWDPETCPLVRLIQWEGLRQQSKTFLPHAFIYSPLGWLLCVTGAAKRLTIIVRCIEECSRCGHRHVFYGELGCGCEACREQETHNVLRRYILDESYVEENFTPVVALTCNECGRVSTIGYAKPTSKSKESLSCGICDRKLSATNAYHFRGAQAIAVPIDKPKEGVKGRDISREETLDAFSPRGNLQDSEFDLKDAVRRFYLDGLSAFDQELEKAKERGDLKRQESSIKWLLVLGALTGGDIPSALRNPPELPDLWEDEFLLNLSEKTIDIAHYLERIRQSSKMIFNEKGVAVYSPDFITQGNFKNKKSHLKDRWEEFNKGGVIK